MTKEQLLELGFYPTNFHKKVYMHECLTIPVYLPESLSLEQVIVTMYERGIEEGKKQGRQIMKNELKELLDIPTE